ncbi:MAG: hypothetical protein K0Q81_2216, partial [Paenibacillus sp.]|nr:hypothetical protein [Paenibacillus sp.]
MGSLSTTLPEKRFSLAAFSVDSNRSKEDHNGSTDLIDANGKLHEIRFQDTSERKQNEF